jgi:hypothetical protein
MENGFDRKYGYTMAYRGKVGGNAETGCTLREALSSTVVKRSNQIMSGAGVALGVGVGLAIGNAMNNIGAGLAIGLALGVASESRQKSLYSPCQR